MSKYLQSILNLLDKTKRHVTIHTADYPFESLFRIGKKLKEQDKNFMKSVGSNRALDNTYVHFLTITKGIRGRTICIGIMEQVYNQLFGEVPESVKRYY